MRNNYQTMSALCPQETPLYACPKQDEKKNVPMDWLLILSFACIKNWCGFESIFGCWN